MRTLVGAYPFDPKNPKVYVAESKDRKVKSVVVDQEPIYFFREHGTKIQIRWQLQTSGYRFDATKGIDNIKALFVKNGCYQCHNYEGHGGAAGARLAPNPLPFRAFVNYVRSPRGDMPPYTSKVMSEQDLADVHAYLRSRPRPAAVSSIPLLAR